MEVRRDARCTFDDAGVALFLLSLPFGQEPEFLNHEITGAIFPKYQKAVLDNFSPLVGNDVRAQFFESFYVPRPYYLFGRFDVAVVSLVDDFEFASRTFHPFDPMMADGTKLYFENFLHKVITGPTPRFGTTSNIVSVSKKTFLAERRRPLFGITLLKLNNSLLIGLGSSFIRAAVNYIHHLSREFQGEGLDVIVLESYAWHEITVLMFGKSYEAMVRLLGRVRESSLHSLSAWISTEAAGDSLLAAFLTSDPTPTKELGEAHVFADSETTLGFDFDLRTDPDSPLWNEINPSDSIQLFTRWYIKPGHLKEARRLVSSGVENVSVTLGRGDLVTQSAGITNTTTQLKSYIEGFEDDQLRRVVLQRYTVPSSLSVPWENLDEPSDTHPFFTHRINDLRFKIETLRQLEDGLRTLGTPKIIALRLLNMYSNFNDGLLDRNLYGFFAELLPFMEDVVAFVGRTSEYGYRENLISWCLLMKRLALNFDLAYRNRFHNSHRLGEITDFNLDFKGGIQQLVSAYDGAYKAIGTVIGNHRSFVSVSGEPAVFSSTYETRLNYFHLFQPEAFLTIAAHEAAWCCFLGSPSMMNAGLKTELGDLKKLINALAGNEVCRDLERAGILSGDENVSAEIRFLREVVVDRLAFCLTYNRNSSLFSYWYLAYFSQVPQAYDEPLQFSSAKVAEFLLRLALVTDVESEQQIEDLLLHFSRTVLGRVASRLKPTIWSALVQFRNDDELAQWRNTAWSFCDRCANQAEPIEHTSVADALSRVDIDASRAIARISVGEVVPFVFGDSYAPFRFVQSLFFGYLRWVKEEFGAGADSLLRRDPDNHHRANPKGQEASLLFDQLGGTFTHDPEIRRKLFRARSALTMSLWDMAVKQKRDILIDRMTQS